MADTVKNTLKQTSRLSKLWDDLRDDPVSPRPLANESRTASAHLEMGYPVSAPFAADLKHPSLVSHYEPERFTATDTAKPVTSIWRNSLEGLFHALVALEPAEPSPLSIGTADPEPEAPADMPVETAPEELLSVSSPFRWEPKPAWIYAPTPQKPPFPNPAAPPRFADRPRIPLRPLHKQPFYKRLFFYVHRWLTTPK